MNNLIIKQINELLLKSIPCSPLDTNLEESMRYSLEAGGKRIRPLLLLETLKMLSDSSDYSKGLQTAIALEMVHTYSLIHDDLPAMDNDDYRRGKPTNHKIYGEWKALLAGDALLTKAFHLISTDALLDAETRIKLVGSLSNASGHLGMIGGQTLDMESENKKISLETLQQIHKEKTGALLTFAIMAAVTIVKPTNEISNILYNYSEHLGLIFQIKDDLLDVYGDEKKLGKPVGSDEKNHKNTYVTLLGQDETEIKLEYHVNQAENSLAQLKNSGYDTAQLEELTKLFYNRDH
ncbi:polyprenyl synthetase family protein [Staphylococcus condimenti]|uniref:Farnesyl diphosphate synthase n=2 Tax=Staphylococcus TaxID=1279 RepID=A0A143PA87_9STAP|nr:farnesyl diphosphate synthase [Staphylococcus condimenti]OFP01467.1 geranyl transferase [Staphylococcus sp. HMSC065E08]AMY04709.1 geranyl transferase [Staphylococcus condimenti]PNZ60890.1 polyprenyl synthetase family protein [Staphylococcus condimenti]QQS83486.1 polyprenyl synthetase family protein [Staphylococcus condimenti]QRP96465.1 polyprenyl synthetase family protein [Staphylococcus condimenti]